MRKWWYSIFSSCIRWRCMIICTPQALYLQGKVCLEPTEYEAGWAAELIWSVWRRKQNNVRGNISTAPIFSINSISCAPTEGQMIRPHQITNFCEDQRYFKCSIFISCEAMTTTLPGTYYGSLWRRLLLMSACTPPPPPPPILLTWQDVKTSC
jgi:hypothetical protein